MALNSIDGSLGGGLLPIAKASRRKLVMMQGEITGMVTAAAITGCLTNGTASSGDTSFSVDTVDATTKFTVGDRIYRAAAADGHLHEIGIVTSVSATTIGVSAGIQTDLTNNDQLLNSGCYNISPDGVITTGTNPDISQPGSNIVDGVVSVGTNPGIARADLVMHFGAGRIVVFGVDHQMGTDPAVHGLIDRNGTALSLEFTFGREKDINSPMNLVSAVGSFGFKRTGGTVGQAEADFLSFGYPGTVSGNTAVFNIGTMYEQEGGSQTNVVDDTILSFCVMAVADDGGGV